jgi:flagellar export protein FliJ
VGPFVFSLEKVLRFKQRREWLAEVGLKQAAAVLQTRASMVAALRDQVAKACDDLPATVGQALDTATWLVGYWQSVRLGEALEAAEQQARQAAKDHQQAAAQRQQAAKEVEVLLTLRKQRWSEHQQQWQKTRQEELDEISLRRWMATQAEQREQGIKGMGGTEP